MCVSVYVSITVSFPFLDCPLVFYLTLHLYVEQAGVSQRADRDGLGVVTLVKCDCASALHTLSR